MRGMVRYKFYATLLDSYQRYLNSQDEGSLQELIDKINRVPFESEAADKGTAFNELVDSLVSEDLRVHDESGVISYPFTNKNGTRYHFKFKTGVVNDFVSHFKGAKAQVYTEGILKTSLGDVLLYGYVDELLNGVVSDIKTTGNYTFPKYLNNWQHLVYPYCMEFEGSKIRYFEYYVTDFNNVYEEIYCFNMERDLKRLRNVCEGLIGFVESMRELITDKKIYALDERVC